MIILGAGMTGCLAAHAFKNSVIHEYLETPNTHNAVLRFRSDAVSELTGIPFRKVKVHKSIFSDGEFVQPNVQLMNNYSKKVTGGYSDRSIADISSSVRWIAPPDFHSRMLYNLGDRIVYGSNIDQFEKPVISTLPLPVLCKRLEIDLQLPQAESAKPIYVTTVSLSNCDVFQTIYFPDRTTNIYRASITGDELIIESIQPIHKGEIDFVTGVFGISSNIHKLISNKEQALGKFIPLPDDIRKGMMYNITQHHGVYSLGRHATWRKVLLDDVVQDIERIERMIKHSVYDLMVGKI